MHTILSLLLALILAFTASAHLADLRDVIDRRQDRLEAAGDALAPGDDAPAMAAAAPGQTVNWEDVVYEHVDPDSFYESAGVLAEERDPRAVTDEYDALYAQLTHAATQAEIAYIRYGGNVSDSYWSDESVYSETVYGQMYDAFLTACRGVMQGPCAGALRDHVGPDLAALFESYEPMSAREAELAARETELIDRYYELMAGAGDVTYTYQGQDWTADTGTMTPIWRYISACKRPSATRWDPSFRNWWTCGRSRRNWRGTRAIRTLPMRRSISVTTVPARPRLCATR